MAVRDYTREIIDTVSQYKPMPRKPIDWSSISNSLNGMQTNFKTQTLADALESGDENAIRQARAALDPTGYANLLEQQAQRAEERKWALEDKANAFNQQKELLGMQLANSMALENARNQNARNLAEFKAGLGASIPQNLPDGYVLTGNKKYDDAYMQEFGKKEAQKKLAEQDSEEMKDSVIKAMLRADKAARSGNGIGRLGAGAEWLGLNPTRNSGKNYTDIESANTQMNTFLRKQLASTGLTGSELNSAVEAEAYRYKVSPFDSEARIRNKLKNFAEDKLGITELDSYKSKYGLD